MALSGRTIELDLHDDWLSHISIMVAALACFGAPSPFGHADVQRLEQALRIAGELGFPLGAPTTSSSCDVAERFYALHRRYLAPKARRVLLSSSFECPASYRAAVERFEQDSAQGQSLTEPLCWGEQPDEYAHLFPAQWCVRCIYLDRERQQEDGRIIKRGPVLFVRATEDTMFVLGTHRSGLDPAELQHELVECMHAQWPESIRPFRSRYVSSDDASSDDASSDDASSNEVALMMRSGAVYSLPAPLTIARAHASEDAERYVFHTKLLHRAEQAIVDQEAELWVTRSRVRCRLVFAEAGSGVVRVVEPGTRTVVGEIRNFPDAALPSLDSPRVGHLATEHS
jgi:hypothetical protein